MKNPNRRNRLNNSIDRKYIKRELKRKKYKKNLWVRIGELISIPLYYTFSFKGDTPASFHFVFPLKRRLCFLSPVKLVPLSTVKFPPPFFLNLFIMASAADRSVVSFNGGGNVSLSLQVWDALRNVDFRTPKSSDFIQRHASSRKG